MPIDFEILLNTNQKIRSLARSLAEEDAPIDLTNGLAASLAAGIDPLGNAYMSINAPAVRRANGETYTPDAIISEMISEAEQNIAPASIIDCGCGSGRFTLACAKAFPRARIVAVDTSEDALLMCKANAAASGISDHIEFRHEDFLKSDFENLPRPILWIGNPPYVRHHDLSDDQKSWLKETGRELDLPVSRLAGLHTYFLAAIARHFRPGDYGILVTSAEWLDVNYGAMVRKLLTQRLALTYLHLKNRTSRVFDGTDTTAVIFGFQSNIAAAESLTLVGRDQAEQKILRSRFLESTRWSRLISGSEPPEKAQSELVPLGSLVSVHRGVVTGNNKFWVRDESQLEGIPESLITPVISHAHELTGDCMAQKTPERLKRLIVLPEDLSTLSGESAKVASQIIASGIAQGVDKGYIARHRRAWWAVQPSEAAPMLMTYMGRRRPSFVVNRQKLPMLNVVHGLYPKVPLGERALKRLVTYLNENVRLEDGRMYAGGLVKFEPKEAEAIMVPPLSVLEA